MQAAVLFQDALLGLHTMHNNMIMMHHDLKPSNIGVIGTPPRCIFLGNGTSAYFQPDMLQPTPGQVGTVNYLAPELEMKKYDAPADIWAMAVILYELTYAQHPWRYAINPWREGKENNELRPAFEESYNLAVEKMSKDYKGAQESPTDGYLHRKCSDFHTQSFRLTKMLSQLAMSLFRW